MISDELKFRVSRLTSLLKKRTIAGTVSWETLREGVYSTSLGNSSFTLESRDVDGIEPYVLQMHDAAGAPVFSVTTTDDDYSLVTRSNIRELYLMIRTSTAQVINLLDGALTELENDE